ncbi:hypothetical protein CAPTEDRAFT_219766 [Capitella teleta]|uniref:HTH CENPB-type domain-containing protein n=1 Tax=Capitella teleta TaxID=283909 RepID=R7V6P6_CAPTE|nr:hypothetical protein CAPTEDRAFT_219766 [Capitella teleta]|eukprot:ELU12041.1 hypothetical protein CAPTEDRAFT_219766 [Capitella teleta]
MDEHMYLSTKRKRTEVTHAMKAKICRLKAGRPKITIAEIHRVMLEDHGLDIGRSTIGDALRESDVWLALPETEISANTCRFRCPRFQELEEALFQWIIDQRHLNPRGPVPDQAIIAQAKIIGSTITMDQKFCYSNGWLQRFKQRRGLVNRRPSTPKPKRWRPSYLLPAKQPTIGTLETTPFQHAQLPPMMYSSNDERQVKIGSTSTQSSFTNSTYQTSDEEPQEGPSFKMEPEYDGYNDSEVAPVKPKVTLSQAREALDPVIDYFSQISEADDAEFGMQKKSVLEDLLKTKAVLERRSQRRHRQLKLTDFYVAW